MSASGGGLKKLQNAKASMRSVETRDKLLRAAEIIFSELGYEAATTRHICDRAGANAAAVNYHFGDKLGLYTLVLERSVINQELLAIEQAHSIQPAEALREFIANMFESLFAPRDAAQYARLMAHEMARPTPALARLVERIIRPRMVTLCKLVARCTGRPASAMETRLAAHSIVAQILNYMHSRTVIEVLWPNWKLDAKTRAAVVDHVVAFSLGGLRATTPRLNTRTRSRKKR
jgi:TetR/AcrR family transcriptional regulator, regulator of cefoperazone and chloramphenicol sensitivity